MKLNNLELRERQGIYRTREAKEFGLTRDKLGQLTGTKVLPGVWSVLPPPLPFEAKCISGRLYSESKAQLGGLTAAAWLGWREPEEDEPIQLYLPATMRLANTGFVTVARYRVPDNWQVVRRMTLMSTPRILLGCHALGLRELTALTAKLIQLREIALPDLATLVVAHPQVPGATLMRAVIADLRSGAQSITEVDTLKVIAVLGFPVPQCQVFIYDGGTLVAIADCYWDGVVAFYDGGFHLRIERQLKDRETRTRLEALGLQVVVRTKSTSNALFGRRLREAFDAAKRRTGPPRWTARTEEQAIAAGYEPKVWSD